MDDVQMKILTVEQFIRRIALVTFVKVGDRQFIQRFILKLRMKTDKIALRGSHIQSSTHEMLTL